VPSAGRLRGGVIRRKVEKHQIQAPANGGRNYNGPKVAVAACFSGNTGGNTWLYAGKSLEPCLPEIIW